MNHHEKGSFARAGWLAALLLAGCSSSGGGAPPSAAPEAGAPETGAGANDPTTQTVERLGRWLAGRFDSKEQAKTDKTYFAISLAVCVANAPELGPRVLYVEQAKIGSSPYRQRLYVLEPVDADVARSKVFELKNPDAAIGACSSETPRTYTAKDVEAREGCEVDLRWLGDRFEGSTPGKRCLSSLNGATYATTMVTLRRDKLLSWDRGWDGDDKQVWGAIAGGYEFVRRSPPPDP